MTVVGSGGFPRTGEILPVVVVTAVADDGFRGKESLV